MRKLHYSVGSGLQRANSVLTSFVNRLVLIRLISDSEFVDKVAQEGQGGLVHGICVFWEFREVPPLSYMQLYC